MAGKKSKTDDQLFMEKVMPVPESGCWLWLGGDTGCGGYGNCSYNGRTRRAHRVSYEMFVGPIPDGLSIDHLCRVRCCVNPKHLEPVTPAVNNRRGNGMAGVNARKTHCINGHEFNESNTRIRKSNGQRKCLICRRIQSKHERELRRRRTA